jgi:hypothetical protein
MPVTVSELSFPVKSHTPCHAQYPEYLHRHDERQMDTLPETIKSPAKRARLSWTSRLRNRV